MSPSRASGSVGRHNVPIHTQQAAPPTRHVLVPVLELWSIYIHTDIRYQGGALRGPGGGAREVNFSRGVCRMQNRAAQSR